MTEPAKEMTEMTGSLAVPRAYVCAYALTCQRHRHLQSQSSEHIIAQWPSDAIHPYPGAVLFSVGQPRQSKVHGDSSPSRQVIPLRDTGARAPHNGEVGRLRAPEYDVGLIGPT